MLHQSFLIEVDFERKINYDVPNQLSCSIFMNNFSMHRSDYEPKNNYEWSQFLESTLCFISTPPGYITIRIARKKVKGLHSQKLKKEQKDLPLIGQEFSTVS